MHSGLGTFDRAIACYDALLDAPSQRSRLWAAHQQALELVAQATTVAIDLTSIFLFFNFSFLMYPIFRSLYIHYLYFRLFSVVPASS